MVWTWNEDMYIELVLFFRIICMYVRERGREGEREYKSVKVRDS